MADQSLRWRVARIVGTHGEVTRALLCAAPKTKYANGVTDQLSLFRAAADNVASSHLNDLERLYDEVEGEPEKNRMREEIYKTATAEASKAISEGRIVILRKAARGERDQSTMIIQKYSTVHQAMGAFIKADDYKDLPTYSEITESATLRGLFNFGEEESVAALMRRRLVDHSSLMVRPHATRHGSQKRSASALDPFDPTGGASKSWELDVSDRPPAAHGTTCRAVVLAAAAGLCPRVETPEELFIYDGPAVTKCPMIDKNSWSAGPQSAGSSITLSLDGSLLVTHNSIIHNQAATSGHNALDDLPFGKLLQFVSASQAAVYVCRPFPPTLWYWRPGGVAVAPGVEDPGSAHYFTRSSVDGSHAAYIDGAERHLAISLPPVESISNTHAMMTATMVYGGVSQAVSPDSLFVGDSASSMVITECGESTDMQARRNLLSAHPFQERGCHDIALRQNVLDAFGDYFPRHKPYGADAAKFIAEDCYTLVQSSDLDTPVASQVIELSNFHDRWCVYQGVSDADTAVGATVVAVTTLMADI